MTTDKVTQAIELIKIDTGSYIDAFLQFMEEQEIHDPEDILEVISPILYNKIKEEFIARNNFGKDSEFAKRKSILDLF